MLEYNDETHQYFLDGTELTSVTKLLTECGIIDTRFFSKGGADNGRRRHKVTELYDQGKLKWEEVLAEDIPYLEAWIQFKEDYEVKIQFIEQQMYHELLDYAGTIDRLADIKGEPTVIDIKTGAKNKATELQLILYGLMVEPKPNLMIVYLKKNGKYKVEEFGYENERYAMAAVRINQWKNR